MLANQAAMCIHVDEARRNQARRIQSERMEASSTIARQIVHEVNNPLGIIKNYIKIIGILFKFWGSQYVYGIRRQ